MRDNRLTCAQIFFVTQSDICTTLLLTYFQPCYRWLVCGAHIGLSFRYAALWNIQNTRLWLSVCSAQAVCVYVLVPLIDTILGEDSYNIYTGSAHALTAQGTITPHAHRTHFYGSIIITRDHTCTPHTTHHAHAHAHHAHTAHTHTPFTVGTSSKHTNNHTYDKAFRLVALLWVPYQYVKLIVCSIIVIIIIVVCCCYYYYCHLYCS